MTAAEFAAARKRLGWTPMVTAVEYDVTPKAIEAFESGSAKVPNKIAADIRFRAAVEEQKAVMEASGLPKCTVLTELGSAFERMPLKEQVESQALVDHVKACELCQKRQAYFELHAPPLPEFPTSLFFRVFEKIVSIPDRFPGRIRPPTGERGEYRRIAFVSASLLSAFACSVALIVAVGGALRAWRSDWWKTPGALGLIVPAYFVGFYLAGWAWDALRPIETRFIGYVLRWGLAGTAIYGAVAVVFPFFNDEPVSLKVSLGIAVLLGGLWALIGAGVWVKDRLWSRLGKLRDVR